MTVTAVAARGSASARPQRRVAWGLVDQVTSSLGTFVFTVLVARELSDAAFGAFGTAMLVFNLVYGTSRALACEPWTIRRAHDSDASGSVGDSCGAALVVGFVVGVPAAIAGLVVGGVVGAGLVPLVVALPGVCLQDAARSLLVARGSPRAATTVDAVWAVALPVAVLGWPAPGVGHLVAMWGLTAAVAGALGCVLLHARPRPERALAWVRREGELGMRLAAEHLVATLTWQAVLLVVCASSGLVGLGAVRGAQTLLGPITVLLLAVPLVVLPEAVRAVRGGGSVIGWCSGTAVALVGLSSSWAVCLAVAPDSWGRAVLGDTWAGASSVAPALGVMTAGMAASAAATVGLRALGEARRTLRYRLAVSPLTFVGGCLGAWVGGPEGAAWGLAAVAAAEAVGWWSLLRREVRRRTARGHAVSRGEVAPGPVTSAVR